MVVYWYLPLFAAMKAVVRTVISLKEAGSIGNFINDLSTYKEYESVVGLDKWLKIEDKCR